MIYISFSNTVYTYTNYKFMADNKKQSLEGALKQIESQFGKGTIMKLGARESVDIPSIATGSFGFRLSTWYRWPTKGKGC